MKSRDSRPPFKLENLLHFVGLLIVLIVCVFPFYWMVAASLKSPPDILSSTPQFFFEPTLQNYVDAFGKFDILKSLKNSLFVALVTVVLSLVLGTPAAYAIARFDFKGKRDIWFWFISNRMLSPIVVALPFFLIARNLKLLDTPWALILIYLTFNVPIVVWICADQFRNIPKELDEAATLEGYNSFAIFWRVGLPLAMPAIAVSAIFTFIFSWNELLYALILTRSEAKTAPFIVMSLPAVTPPPRQWPSSW